MFPSEQEFSEEFIEYCRKYRHLFAYRPAKIGDWFYNTHFNTTFQIEQNRWIDFRTDILVYLPDFDFMLEQIKLQVNQMGFGLQDCEVTITNKPKGNWVVTVVLPKDKSISVTESSSLGVALFSMCVMLSALRTRSILASALETSSSKMKDVNQQKSLSAEAAADSDVNPMQPVADALEEFCQRLIAEENKRKKADANKKAE